MYCILLQFMCMYIFMRIKYCIPLYSSQPMYTISSMRGSQLHVPHHHHQVGSSSSIVGGSSVTLASSVGGGGGGGMGGGGLCSWPARNSPVFAPLNAIMERCNDLLDLVQTVHDFRSV